MYVNYKAGVISVTETETEIVTEFDINTLSLFSTEGKILFRIHNHKGWGDWVHVPKNVAFNDKLAAHKIQIKADAGTVEVNYFLAGA